MPEKGNKWVRQLQVIPIAGLMMLSAAGCSTSDGMTGTEQILRDNRERESTPSDAADPGQPEDDGSRKSDLQEDDRDLEALQTDAFNELKKAQEPYSARQNRLACSFMITNPAKAREAHPSDSPLTWEEFVDPLLASCWEWIEGMSEQEMEALVIYENEVAPDIFGVCDNYRQIGKKETRKAMKEWLELSGKPASLAGEIADLIARECKKR